MQRFNPVMPDFLYVQIHAAYPTLPAIAWHFYMCYDHCTMLMAESIQVLRTEESPAINRGATDETNQSYR